jgi:hypothetical protein
MNESEIADSLNTLLISSRGIGLVRCPSGPHKGMLFEDLHQFVAQYISNGKRVLCEARNYEECLKDKCPLFRGKSSEEGREHGICSEFKAAFSKS